MRILLLFVCLFLSRNLQAADSCTLSLPNVVSSGEGSSDIFTVVSTCRLDSLYGRVYDRYGVLIGEQRIGEIRKGFDVDLTGLIKRRIDAKESGTVYCIVEYWIAGQKFEKHGAVTLLL